MRVVRVLVLLLDLGCLAGFIESGVHFAPEAWTQFGTGFGNDYAVWAFLGLGYGAICAAERCAADFTKMVA